MKNNILRYSELVLKHKRQQVSGEDIPPEETNELERLKSLIGQSHKEILRRASEEILKKVKGGH